MLVEVFSSNPLLGVDYCEVENELGEDEGNVVRVGLLFISFTFFYKPKIKEDDCSEDRE